MTAWQRRASTSPVWAGVRKNSDAAVGILAELSTNSDSTNGTFALAASVSGNNYYTQSRGTVRSVQYATGYVAPNSAVLVAEAKISTDTLRLHVNNAAPLSSATRSTSVVVAAWRIPSTDTYTA